MYDKASQGGALLSGTGSKLPSRMSLKVGAEARPCSRISCLGGSAADTGRHSCLSNGVADGRG